VAENEHHYSVTVEWTGNAGTGTSAYRAYERAHEISGTLAEKPPIPGSADPAYRGDPARWNPEELLVASISTCHELWYLHVCAVNSVVVTEYVDHAEGWMPVDAKGVGSFRRVLLRPIVTITQGSDAGRARELHDDAHRMCNIASSVNFPIDHEPEIRIAQPRA
jgi:organic hydroperoxide reductase OsmC/OhrA